jgi:DNA-directed RNA polymerase
MNTHSDILEHPLFERQLLLEREMRTAGIDRFKKRVEKVTANGQMTELRSVTRLVVSSHDRMVEAVEQFIAEAGKGAGRRNAALPYITKLEPDVVSNLTARAVLNDIGRPVSMNHTAIILGTMIENEVNARIFDKEMPKAYKKFHKKAETETLARRKWSHLLFPAKLLGVKLEEWETRIHLLIGMKLIELFQISTGLITVKTILGAKGSITLLEANEDTLQWIEEENKRLEHLFPTLMPCIIPPKPWTTPFDGGYYSQIISRPTLVKTHNKEYLQELGDRDMEEVYGAVNALQETAWSINVEVLDVMRTLYESNSPIGDIPQAEVQVAPTKPYWLPSDGTKMGKEDMTPEQRDEFDAWKREAHRVHVENAKMRGRRAVFLRTIAVAERFRDEEAMYFPHQLDWRGRAYPLPLYLTPQGNDMQRGLLEFANGVQITDQDGADWLAIHGAGMFGYDKVSLEDRIAWVMEHEAQVLATASNPYDNRFWLDADKPWQFLAFCFDWAGYRAEGFDFVSSLPVQMDGTCNGLQNFSAMLLDEIGGAAVNLIPATTPQDIYQRVADLVKIRIEADLFSDEPILAKHTDEEGNEVQTLICTIGEIARGWHGNVNRKTTKRPVMTLAYGAVRYGFVKQVDEDTIKPWRESDPVGYPFIRQADNGKPYDFGYQAAMYMGGLIWEEVGNVVVAARQAMDWLQVVSKVASQQGLPIHWTTPAGFLVQQAYRVPNVKRVDTTFNSQRLTASYQMGVGKIDSRKQASGISPNWVHSLDASHLMKTIVACHAQGIRSFSMIHDSYGTHAGNAWAMAQILREKFVQMYQHVCTLGNFKTELEQQINADLPAIPPKGNLDLNVVLDSPFFFA